MSNVTLLDGNPSGLAVTNVVMSEVVAFIHSVAIVLASCIGCHTVALEVQFNSVAVGIVEVVEIDAVCCALKLVSIDGCGWAVVGFTIGLALVD